ncbi:hypothetical protein [Lutispora thermophila]|uniref:Uncharacterized protein n=1 Tax=Lutispora thermophila DSM 19022 TaxID=1122184 RepID=A0A1M6CQP1_9FIRM|nr:hypothetical protein [Lutispora thermophila]SHI63415.1 hypothetical protein SAMN02745176_00902 [Lutispora thermophila DSM 19022]
MGEAILVRHGGGGNVNFPDGWNEQAIGKAYEAITKADPIMLKRMGLWESGVNKVNDPDILPPIVRCLEWSTDDTYLTVGHVYSTYITIYKGNGDTFTKIANPLTLPTSIVSSVRFSPSDGTYLAIGNSSQSIIIYKSDVYDSIQKITKKNQYFTYSPPEWKFGIAMETISAGNVGKVILFPKIYNLPSL